MLNFFVADQCTERHNKSSQPTCLDVFDKNLHALPVHRVVIPSKKKYVPKFPAPPPTQKKLKCKKKKNLAEAFLVMVYNC